MFRPMSIWGKFVGAAAGMAIGGPLGALVGAFAGHYGYDRSRADGGGEAEPEDDIAFTIGVIALGAKMAKADGIVTKDEVDAFKQVFVIAPEDMKSVSRVFNLAKRDISGYDAYAQQLAGLFKDKPDVLEDVVDGLFHIAKADNVVHPSELDFLRSVSEILYNCACPSVMTTMCHDQRNWSKLTPIQRLSTPTNTFRGTS